MSRAPLPCWEGEKGPEPPPQRTEARCPLCICPTIFWRTRLPKREIPLTPRGLTRIAVGRRVQGVKSLHGSFLLQGTTQTRQRGAQRPRTTRVLSHTADPGMTPPGGLQDQTWAPQAQSVPLGAMEPACPSFQLSLIPAGATWRACFYPVHRISPGA